MALHSNPQQHGLRLPTWHRSRNVESGIETTDAAATTTAAAYALAGTRILLGFVFLWAFFDKAFGWGYATPAARSWVNGGSPTRGFLKGVSAGPMQSTFHSWAGNGAVDWLFMLGLLGIGLGLVGGVALRLTAAAGTAMMAFMWMAEWPPARHLADGSASMSSNPFVDYHVMFAAIMIVLAVTAAGSTLGLGRIWARLPLVNRSGWLR
jgi:thiosulfate dehydrogenase [quinone] large subunit